MGTARSQGENITLTTEERKHAMMILQNLNKKYEGRISAQAGPLYIAQMLKDIDNRISNGEGGINGRGVFSSCGCVFHRMAVLHDGTMVPCTMLPTLVMGVIGMHSLKDLWLTSPAINSVRLRRNIPLSIIPECKECRYIDFCTGGCPASVMAKTGRIMGIDPLSCYNECKKEA
jgi:radical SAM protein with 4Fe4S-binding SPASM domain